MTRNARFSLFRERAQWFVLLALALALGVACVYALLTGNAVLLPRRSGSLVVLTNARHAEPAIYWLSTGVYALLSAGLAWYLAARREA